MRTIAHKNVSDGAHRLALSIILAVTTMPKTAVATFPILATLGHVTDRLQVICGWDANLINRVKDACRIRNQKVASNGLFSVFFNTLRPDGYPGMPETPTQDLGRYYKLMMAILAHAKLDEAFWRSNTSTTDLELAQKLFNKPDSDVAIITSELLDLANSDLAMTDESNLNEEAMSEPGSYLSGLDSIRDMDPIFDQSINEEFVDAAVSQESARWSEHDLAFFEGTKNSVLLKVDADRCLYFDMEENGFCKNPAVANARCTKHQNTANSNFMQILSRMNNSDEKVGFSLCSSAFRLFCEPQIRSDFVEYAPSLEGSLPQFKHSKKNLRKCLAAGFKSYKAGYLTRSDIHFKDNFFRDEFPNSPEISARKWMHVYLSLRVSKILAIVVVVTSHSKNYIFQ